MQQPFYNPEVSYEENYKKGPFGSFANNDVIVRTNKPQFDFFGHKLFLPFGIPAGPLLNANFITAAFRKGFDLCVYKTVRTNEYPCHPWPNVLAVHEEKLEINRTFPVVADSSYVEPLSITNSFGVPSANPKIWQQDMAKAVKNTGIGQLMIGSFQGTSDGSGNVDAYIKDFVRAAELVKETGTKVLEANLSCPNEGTAHLLCFDIERTLKIAQEIKKAIGDTPLILKLAYFDDDNLLESFVKKLGPVVDGFSAINTIAAAIVDKDGKQALPGKGRERSGVCGRAITWAGLDMVSRLIALRKKLQLKYVVIGVGGVTKTNDYFAYRKNGADAVMSATGAMWHQDLAAQILNKIKTLN
ncbi:MAG: dihydroorotate oxidase [Candidatus Pacebacteria bacterium CG10_big_fil_rev_8_21_14_0_10_36_11]|nr:dihydroorotate oxidase [Candidatus Pacearchaeota archaeon]OIP73669.1 MAG: dihydroorotate oxidase [Candidatus Pacebacteria bacterium CG2_30_36_39]PIR64749.1 MAG: dihydroorotate oxidase [Candidatus Pacebacteria bacterium CG10_big_fil_rev_8_21_14_0_10_36_11]PJC43059.1 MAG: dihydroorotate oxidase [Candidatus Pacebacteria bacterium CG_4_9_14_0_2_um_filter_36_8]